MEIYTCDFITKIISQIRPKKNPHFCGNLVGKKSGNFLLLIKHLKHHNGFYIIKI